MSAAYVKLESLRCSCHLQAAWPEVLHLQGSLVESAAEHTWWHLQRKCTARSSPPCMLLLTSKASFKGGDRQLEMLVADLMQDTGRGNKQQGSSVQACSSPD